MKCVVGTIHFRCIETRATLHTLQVYSSHRLEGLAPMLPHRITTHLKCIARAIHVKYIVSTYVCSFNTFFFQCPTTALERPLVSTPCDVIPPRPGSSSHGSSSVPAVLQQLLLRARHARQSMIWISSLVRAAYGVATPRHALRWCKKCRSISCSVGGESE